MSKKTESNKNPNLAAKERGQRQAKTEKRVTRFMVAILILVGLAFAGFVGVSAYRIWQNNRDVTPYESERPRVYASDSYMGEGDFTKVIRVDASMLMKDDKVDPIAYFGPSQKDTYRFGYLDKDGKPTGDKDIVQMEMTEEFYNKFISDMGAQMEKDIQNYIGSTFAEHVQAIQASADDNFANITVTVSSEGYDPSNDIFPAILGEAVKAFQSYTEQGVTGCTVTIQDENGDFIATIEPK